MVFTDGHNSVHVFTRYPWNGEL